MRPVDARLYEAFLALRAAQQLVADSQDLVAAIETVKQAVTALRRRIEADVED